jgi:hypothetical protein
MAQANFWDRTMKPDRRETANHASILTPEEARQGVISGRVRLVLMVSLMLSVIAGAIVYVVAV